MFSKFADKLKGQISRNLGVVKASMRLLVISNALFRVTTLENSDNTRAARQHFLDEVESLANFFKENAEIGLYVHALVIHKGSVSTAEGFFEDIEHQSACLKALREIDELIKEHAEAISNDVLLLVSTQGIKIMLYVPILNVELQKPNVSRLPIDADDIISEVDKLLAYVKENRKKINWADTAIFVAAALGVRINANLHSFRFLPDSRRSSVAEEILSDIDTFERGWVAKLMFSASPMDRRRAASGRSVARIEIGIFQADQKLIEQGIFKLIEMHQIPAFGDGEPENFSIDLDHILWCLKGVEHLEPEHDSIPVPFCGWAESIIKISFRMLLARRFQRNDSFIEASSLLANLFRKRGDWERLLEASSAVLDNVHLSISGDRNFEDIQYHISKLENLSGDAAYAIQKLCISEEPTVQPYRGVSASEAGRSLGWKFNRLKWHPQDGAERLFNSLTFGVNKEVTDRVTVYVQVTNFNTIMHFLYYTDGKPNIEVSSTEALTQSKIDAFVFGHDGWDQSYNRIRHAVGQLGEATKEHAWQAWNLQVAKTLTWLWAVIGSKLAEKLDELGIPVGTNVHLVCSAPLLNLPIHSCGFQTANGQWTCLNDRWFVTIADSLLHRHFQPAELRQRERATETAIRLNIVNPSGDLRLANSAFLRSESGIRNLVGVDATKEKVLEHLRLSTLAVFLCHAHFDSDDPETSGIELAEGDILSIADLRDLDLMREPVVVLGACETTVGDARYQRSEARNLAAGFLWAGAAAVIGAGWPIAIGNAERVVRELLDKKSTTARDHFRVLTALQRRMRRGEVMPLSRDEQNQKFVVSHLRVVQGAESDSKTRIDKGIDDLSRPAAWSAFCVYSR